MKKKFLIIVFAAVFALSLCCGCHAVDGADGRNGQDLNIYEIYEAANAAREEEGLGQIGFLEFLKEYLNYEFTYSEEKSAQEIMNRSLMSCVAVMSGFRFRLGKIEYFAGAGVMVDVDKSAGDAYILTNCHVVYDDSSTEVYASEVYVYLYGNDGLESSEGRIPASIVGASLSYDLALLKIENCDELKSGEYTAADFSREEDVYCGEQVYTIGNPEGTGISLTRGIVSRESEIISVNLSTLYENDDNYLREYRVIRTDAAVNGGNSGGGLFDSNGKLIGVINSKAISEEIENMGYALAGSYARRVWTLMRDGYTSRGSLYGLRRARVPVNYDYKSSAYFDNEKNIAVIRDKVYATSSSDGIIQGDIFKRIKISDTEGRTVEDVEITRYYNLEDVLLSARDNYKIIYTVERNGEEKTVETKPSFINIL